MTSIFSIGPPHFSGRKPALFASTARAALAAMAFCGIAAAPVQAQGLPTGGSVAAGQASISGNTTSMTIQQSSPTAVLNWQSFDIAAGKSVEFVQPGSSSVA
ncbi:MAG: hypothetical protein Q7J32_10550, partial [Sphingomonadaceae bacterium]|nr:hypothetical protein [Sphingomonadaceae bacterium]